MQDRDRQHKKKRFLQIKGKDKINFSPFYRCMEVPITKSSFTVKGGTHKDSLILKHGPSVDFPDSHGIG